MSVSVLLSLAVTVTEVAAPGKRLDQELEEMKNLLQRANLRAPAAWGEDWGAGSGSGFLSFGVE